MHSELKPCPFCCGEAHVSGNMRRTDNWVICTECDVIYPAKTNREYTEAEAIEAWNTRAGRTCKLIDRGSFMPKHDFYRSECSACGAMFWQTNGHLPRANYCPDCGAKVVE